MKLQKLAGATSEIWQVFIRDSSSTTGAGLTGLANNTAGLTAYYHRDTDTTATAISLVSMTVGTFTSSGFKEIDSTNMPGWYQFCPPNAALASGAKSCAFHLKGATNMAPLPIEVQLLAVNVDDAVRMGMTALPNANAEAAGGLYTRGSGAGQINQAANGMIDANVVRNAGTAITAAAGIQEVKVASIAANAITATSIASDAITDAKVASDVTIASVTGAVGSVTGAVGSVTGLTASNLDVAVSTRLASGSYTAPPSAATIAQAVWDALTSALTTVGSIGKLLVTNVDAAISTRSSYGGADTSGTTTLLSRLTSTRAGLLDHLDADISSRMATFSYTAPLDAAGTRAALGLASADLDTQIATLATAAGLSDLSDGISASFTALQSHGDGAWTTATGFATSAALTTVSGNVDGIKAVTDSLVMTDGKLWVLDDQGNPLRHSDEIASDFSTLSSHGDTAWATATGFAAPGDVPAASDNAAAVLAATYEGSETVQDHFRLARAALYGKANGLATTTAHYRDAADTKNRITATVDADGNRSAVSTDAT